MFGTVISALFGFAALATALFFLSRKRRRMADAIPAQLRAVDLEEQLGQDGDVYHHIVFQVVDGPYAGRRMVSELGHGNPPMLPLGVLTEQIHPTSGKVSTRAALRFEAVLIAVFAVAGLVAVAAAFIQAFRSGSPN